MSARTSTIQNRRIRRGITAAALAAGVLLPVAAAGPATAAAPTVTCSSNKAGLAKKLTADLTAALRGRPGTVALALYERSTNTYCSLRSWDSFDSASIVKVTVLGALLHDAQKKKRALSATERNRVTAMITKSDNNATSALWKQLGTGKINAFLKAAGMTRTKPGANGYWGLTQVNASEQSKLLALLTRRNTVLTDASRAYALDRMARVVPAQRWGTPAGAPGAAKVQVKNGWLPRATKGWRVHSLGVFTGLGHDYTITVLTHGNKTMQQGVDTIQAVSRAAHRDLNPAASGKPRTFQAPVPAVTPPAVPHEVIPPVPEAPAH
ncbi:class A beta-lactamase-related serine hydrolase [Streptomyces sp. NBC_00237]|uniref:serine hydrolase n=1 Tax=Streptomyces sp. NBC_00237 TaxID=2975687 RepID=UPI002254B166|nr:serine hydrolase [Streptomyces sp. NBC_00237]MCX5201124.1 class A beta-lactamase-related serine hydrolase [Streptomyces sp. NBC_00237]